MTCAHLTCHRPVAYRIPNVCRRHWLQLRRGRTLTDPPAIMLDPAPLRPLLGRIPPELRPDPRSRRVSDRVADRVACAAGLTLELVYGHGWDDQEEACGQG
jgi:hypothetical protein